MAQKYQNKYRIESNRYQYWDYSSAGYYFITICIENRLPILGEIINGIMHLSELGEIVKKEFLKIEKYNPRIILDEWIVMPDHIHCIIELKGYNFNNGIALVEQTNSEKIHEFSLNPTLKLNKRKPVSDDEIMEYRKLRRKMLIPKILGKFKMQTSKQINIARGTPGIKNWQSDYYDYIIWNDEDRLRIKNYIERNPEKWYEEKIKNA